MGNPLAAAKVALVVIAMGVLGYVLGPPVYWYLHEEFAAMNRSLSPSACPPCVCDCSSTSLLNSPEDCAKQQPDASNDTDKDSVELLTEELKVNEAKALAKQKRADMVLLENKKILSQYQKEADKCNSGMETCEEAREKAEAALTAQKKVTALWELRARERGWREEGHISRTGSDGRVQTA